MGHFSSFAQFPDFEAFFAMAGLPWDAGSYTRNMLVLNSQATGIVTTSKLLPEYSQKALYLRNARMGDAWYHVRHYPDYDDESPAPPPLSANHVGESPVLLASVGEGKLGYVGDVNAEKGSEAVVLAMCGL